MCHSFVMFAIRYILAFSAVFILAQAASVAKEGETEMEQVS